MPKDLTHEKIIEKLRSDNHYYGDFGRQWISNSDIKILLSNIEQYGQKVKENENLAKGRYFHQLLLEPDKAKSFPICDVKTRSKEYKEFLEENNLEFALKTSEARDVELMVEWFMEKDNKKTIGIKEYLFDLGAKYEEPMVRELYEGVTPFKGKADVISRGMIIDLKTSSDVYKFAKNAPFFGYHTQAYIYNALFEMPMVFFVIGKERKQYGTISGDYYDVGIFNVSPEFIDRGREAVEHALVHYQDYFSEKAKKSIDEIVLKATL